MKLLMDFGIDKILGGRIRDTDEELFMFHTIAKKIMKLVDFYL